MIEEIHNVAAVKKHLSELIGQVAYGKKQILITKRGKPMARLIPVRNNELHLANTQGWLDDDDAFFDTMERIINDRSKHLPQILK